MRIGREHGNAINKELADGLISAIREAEAADGVRGVLFAAAGKLFCPGLDLRELIELDRAGMRAFLESFNGCFRELYAFSKPLVAAMHGHAIAGGYLLSLTADWRILRQGAQVGLAEIKVGVPFPYGIAQILRASVPAAALTKVALLGTNYLDGEALEAGLVHEVHPADGFEDYCRQRLVEMAAKDARAFAISKRYLRAATIERVASAEARNDDEFLESWFSEETQRRMTDLVESLRQAG
jgi:enoyl-CoA hydratase